MPSITSACNCLSIALAWQALSTSQAPRRSDAHHHRHTTTTSPIDTATKAAKNAFYVTVGLGVMGFQQAKEGQEGLRNWFETQVSDGKTQFETFTSQLPKLDGVSKSWEAQAKQLEERLTALEEPLRGHPRQPAGEPARAGGRAHEASAGCGEDRPRTAQGPRQPRLRAAGRVVPSKLASPKPAVLPSARTNR